MTITTIELRRAKVAASFSDEPGKTDTADYMADAIECMIDDETGVKARVTMDSMTIQVTVNTTDLLDTAKALDGWKWL